MTIDGDILEIELDMQIDDVIELKNFVATRLEYIEEVQVVGELESFSSASLLQLLYSMKKSKPSLSIPIIESDLSLKNYGVMHWRNSRK